MNFSQQTIAYCLIFGLEINIGDIIFKDLINKLQNGKKNRETNVCYTRYISLVLEQLLGENYHDESLTVLKPHHISAASFQTPSASEVSLTSHMLKVAKLSMEPDESLILPSEEVNAEATADKSQSGTNVQPLSQPKAPNAKKSKKKKIPSLTQPKDLEECMDDGDSRVAKEAKLFDALEHKSVVIEDVELDLADSVNYVTEKVLENMGFVHASLSNYGRKMVNDVNMEIHGVKFKADFVVLDYVNEGEPSILFGRDFLATTKSQVDFELGEIRMNLTKFKEGIDMIDLLEEVGSSSEEVVKMGKANRNKEDDWLGSFEVERDKDGNMKYGPVAPSFIDMEKKDDMERALAMEANFNPFENVIVFKKLVNFLGSLPVQLKNLDWGNEGYGTYKKVDGDGDWHARFEIVTPSGRKFNRAFKTKTTTRKLSGNFKTEDILRKGALEYQGLLTSLEVDDKHFDHKDYWTRVGKPTLTNHKEVLVKEPLMRIMHKVIVGSLVHRVASRERYQKQDLWMMSALEESRGVNLAWIIADHLYKHAPRTKENSIICVGYYVTKIACSLGYCVDDEIKKCLEPIDCEYWTSKINQGGSFGLGGDDYFAIAMPNFGVSTSGNEFRGSSRGVGFNDDDDDDDMDE
ncbi:hypothetical protein Tco_0002012 [Tanacetum coccineum]